MAKVNSKTFISDASAVLCCLCLMYKYIVENFKLKINIFHFNFLLRFNVKWHLTIGVLTTHLMGCLWVARVGSLRFCRKRFNDFKFFISPIYVNFHSK